jgi:hypothetical protein
MKVFAAGVSAILLTLAIPQVSQAWIQYLDGSVLPEAPWISYQDGPDTGRGDTVVVDFIDPANGATNKALRVDSGDGSNEWYVGPVGGTELVAAARFRLAAFSPTGRENLLCVQVGGSGTHAPSVSISLVDGRYKIWAYTVGVFGSPTGGAEIQDISPVSTNDFHTSYIYAHKDGMTKVWWDGKLIYDDVPISLGGYDGYVEWGSGSWQWSASDTLDFDWVGWGDITDLPQSFTSAPAHGSVQQDAATQFTFSVVTTQGPGVGTNGITITVNGVDRTGDLTISGTDTNRQGALPGLVANRIYQARVRVTDLGGMPANYTVDFDTFSRTNFTIEAEDFNFDAGQFLDTIVLSSAFGADNYRERDGVQDIDHNELSTDPAGSRHDYRSGSLVGTEETGDALRQKFLDAQANDPGVTDYNVTGVAVGEWLNYTRTFPAGNYNIYGRFAYGEDGAPFEATMDRLSRATTSNQTLTPLGVFKGIGHHAQEYSYVPLTDAQGNPLSVNLGGIETLRATLTQGGFNANFYMWVPAQAVRPTLNVTKSGTNLVISWTGSGFTLESTDRLGASWSPVTNQSNPFPVTPSEAMRFYRLRQ